MKAIELLTYLQTELIKGNIDPNKEIQFELYHGSLEDMDRLPDEIVNDDVKVGYVGSSSKHGSGFSKHDPLDGCFVVYLGLGSRVHIKN